MHKAPVQHAATLCGMGKGKEKILIVRTPTAKTPRLGGAIVVNFALGELLAVPMLADLQLTSQGARPWLWANLGTIR